MALGFIIGFVVGFVLTMFLFVWPLAHLPEDERNDILRKMQTAERIL